ncbi:MAG: histidine phosphatase family protein [Acidimicrobiia bacterium]|nr:histidine phosphatase family protein [Acidimicrobiia bacterium]
MTIYLVRHAAAGDRYRWSGDDLERPLDERGRAQAQAIADFFTGRPISRLISSRAVRCTQTLAPLAHRLGLDIEPTPALLEGASGDEAAELVRSLTDTDTVLCSHGDVLPAVVRSLTVDGMRIVGGRGCEKGSVWELEVQGHDIVSGAYRGMPPIMAA